MDSAQSNDVLGEVQFEGKTNVEKTSGVWVDGQYVGYINELKLSKRVLLLPGDHTISVRQNGYQDFSQTIVVQPGKTQIIRVAMNKAAGGAPLLALFEKGPARQPAVWESALYITIGQ